MKQKAKGKNGGRRQEKREAGKTEAGGRESGDRILETGNEHKLYGLLL